MNKALSYRCTRTFLTLRKTCAQSQAIDLKRIAINRQRFDKFNSDLQRMLSTSRQTVHKSLLKCTQCQVIYKTFFRLFPMTETSKSKFLPRLLAYVLADLFGFACLALGVAWFAGGPGTLLEHFPASTAEAFASAAGGLAVIAWAMTRILQTLGQLAPPRDD